MKESNWNPANRGRKYCSQDIMWVFKTGLTGRENEQDKVDIPADETHTGPNRFVSVKLYSD